MKKWRIALAVSSALFQFTTTQLSGQPPARSLATESNSPEHRERCLQRAAVAAGAARIRDLPDARREQVRDLRQCRESAGAVLPELWRRVTADSTDLAVLMDASSPVRDRRIAEVLENILADETKESLVRQAAAVVLTIYVLPRFRGVVKAGPQRGDTWWVDLGQVSHLVSDSGASPLAAGFRDRVIRLIENARSTAAPGTGTMYPLTGYLLVLLRQAERSVP